MAAYNGDQHPATDNDRKSCMGSVNDTCSAGGISGACQGGFAGLVGSAAITIQPNSSVVVYTAAYFANTTGNFVLNAHTDSLL